MTDRHPQQDDERTAGIVNGTTGRFAGFLDHVEKYLGRIMDAVPEGEQGLGTSFSIAECHSSGGQLYSAVSYGLALIESEDPSAGVEPALPQELVCTVHRAQIRAAVGLVAAIGQLLAEARRRAVFGEVIPLPVPLDDARRIAAVAVARHPYLDDDFDIVPGADGTPELELAVLLPITRAELDIVARHGLDHLRDLWDERDSDLLDLGRASV